MSKRGKLRYELNNDLYRVLGVPPNATHEEIQRAFRNRAKETHPDRNPDRPEWAKAEFLRINDAYATLGDWVTRSEYDRLRGQYFARASAADKVAGTWASSRAGAEATRRATDPEAWWNKPHPRAQTGARGDKVGGTGGTPPEGTPTDEPDAHWPGSPWRAGRPPPDPTKGYLGTVFAGLAQGPYRYVFFVIAVVLVANVLFILAAQERDNAIAQARFNATVTAATILRANSTLEASSVFVQSPLPRPYRGTTLPFPATCDDPAVRITHPTALSTVGEESLTVAGSAAPTGFESYLLVLDPLDEPTLAPWVLRNPIRTPVRDGELIRQASMRGVPDGRYTLRLLVMRVDGSLLPPCEIPIIRQRN